MQGHTVPSVHGRRRRLAWSVGWARQVLIPSKSWSHVQQSWWELCTVPAIVWPVVSPGSSRRHFDAQFPAPHCHTVPRASSSDWGWWYSRNRSPGQSCMETPGQGNAQGHSEGSWTVGVGVLTPDRAWGIPCVHGNWSPSSSWLISGDSEGLGHPETQQAGKWGRGCIRHSWKGRGGARRPLWEPLKVPATWSCQMPGREWSLGEGQGQ